jgi:hypothetical protein
MDSQECSEVLHVTVVTGEKFSDHFRKPSKLRQDSDFVPKDHLSSPRHPRAYSGRPTSFLHAAFGVIIVSLFDNRRPTFHAAKGSVASADRGVGGSWREPKRTGSDSG